ncbi:oligosaccharide flippase family protein [Photobacterium nomapromontoriensis]|uniref:oligosaccharide flippase family protein n=1 Tax=Photobacterium nomapromontoriensis TaxID=2910237 RepID=UPI003D0CC1DF
MPVTNNEGLFHSAKWAFIANWYSRLIGIVNTLVLLKLLSPDDFGLAALSTFFVSMFVAFSHVGVAHFVISSDDMSEDELDSIWTLGLVIKTVTTFCLYFSAEWIAIYVNNMSMVYIIQAVAIIPFLSGLRNVALDKAEKDYKFKRVIATTMVARTAGAVVSIVLAIMLVSYWALIIGVIVSVFVETIVGYILFPRRPRLSYQYWHKQWCFSKWLYVSSVFGYLRSRIDVLLLGNIVNTRDVGLYSVSTEFSWLPFNELIIPINRGFFSVLSRVKNDSAEYYQKVVQQFSINMLIVFPCSLGMMSIAIPFTDVILGDEWHDASELIYVLSPLMIVMSVYGLLNTIMTIQKKMKLLILSDLIFLFGIIVFFISYHDSNMFFLAHGRVWIGLIYFFWLIALLLWVVRIKYNDIVMIFIPPLLSSFVMYHIVEYSISLFYLTTAQLVIGVVIGAVSYIFSFVLISYQCRKRYPYHWSCCVFVFDKYRLKLIKEGRG